MTDKHSDITFLFINGGDHPMSFGSHVYTGKKPSSSIHNPWSTSMNFSHVWKGLAVVAVLFLFSMEAAAQLPVRTQSLQLISSGGGGTVTQNIPAAGITSYVVSWPAEATTAFPLDGDEAILIGTRIAANDIDLRWEASDGFVDGAGADNHVTFWDPDNNTLAAQESFEFNPVTGVMRVGVDVEANPIAPDDVLGGTAGVIEVGDNSAVATIVFNGTNASGTFGNATTAGEVIATNVAGVTTVNLDGASATATIGSAGAGAAGTINVTSAVAAVNGAVIAGTSGTATLGNDGLSGEVVLYDGEVALLAHTATLSSGIQVENQAIAFDIPDAAAPGSRIVPLAINSAQTAGQILFSVGNGTAEWRSNPSDYIQSGVVAMAGGLYTQSIVFPTDYSSLVPAVPAGNISVTVTTNGPAADANILQVTNISVTGFDVLSSAPLVGATINWIAVGRP